MSMKLTTSKYASYLYVKNEEDIKKPLITKELGNSGIYVDYDADGEIFGIEFLDNIEVVKNE